jgi:hypothetical protein
MSVLYKIIQFEHFPWFESAVYLMYYNAQPHPWYIIKTLLRKKEVRKNSLCDMTNCRKAIIEKWFKSAE